MTELKSTVTAAADASSEGDSKAVSATGRASTRPLSGGVVFTWGTGSAELGHTSIDKEGVCPFPVRVESLKDVVQVACGEQASGAITGKGELFLWGSGRGGRLGHGSEEDVAKPKAVAALARVVVTALSIGQSHTACVAGGLLCTFGKNFGGDVLGQGSDAKQCTVPGLVLTGAGQQPLADVVSVSCGNNSTACVTASGALYSWGRNEHGKLGLGLAETTHRAFPQAVKGLPPVAQVSVGSCFAAVVTREGHLFSWGLGAFGNLGHGDRKSSSVPLLVRALADAGQRMVSVHCTVGQINPALAADVDSLEGKEGAHCMAVGADGSLWTWGTSHKGQLGNMRNKCLIVKGGDELTPYRVGGKVKDVPKSGPSGYLSDSRVVQAAASSIHSACLDSSGRLYSFGCGSGGRMGVQQFMTGLHGGRSRMKCYVSPPTLVEGLDGKAVRVAQFDTAKRHMIALAVPVASVDASKPKPKSPSSASRPVAIAAGAGGGVAGEPKQGPASTSAEARAASGPSTTASSFSSSPAESGPVPAGCGTCIRVDGFLAQHLDFLAGKQPARAKAAAKDKAKPRPKPMARPKAKPKAAGAGAKATPKQKA